jgi:hypothetical protein
MAAFTKFQPFVEALAEKKHNLGSDQLVIALTNNANPPLATDAVLADQVEISYTNLSSRNVTTVSSVQTSGTYKLTLTDLVLTASGTVPAFRFVLLFNDTAAADDLIGWWDYGSDLILLSGETFTVDFDGAAGVLTIA